jgi:hypothetical protein
MKLEINKMKTTTTVLLAVMATIASAQDIKPPREMGGGGFTIGFGSTDVSMMKTFVNEGGRSFSNSQLVIGGTGHAFAGDFVIGGTGYGIIGDKIKSDTAQVSLGGGLGTLDLGHLIVNKEKLKLFPTVGIGWGGYGISISENKNLSVDDIRRKPGREIQISNGGFVFDLALNVQFIPVLTYDDKEDAFGGFMTGWRIGYAYSIPNSDWTYSGGDITNGPNFGLNMLYVKFVIGGFGYKPGK